MSWLAWLRLRELHGEDVRAVRATRSGAFADNTDLEVFSTAWALQFDHAVRFQKYAYQRLSANM
jgi:hypothetical protein